jgi:4-amino-4-deoxy-L-arabinose transferase-like glycosyltransferase
MTAPREKPAKPGHEASALKAGRREAIWIGVATLMGAVIRAWGMHRLGLDHFDEGIYAISGLWVTSPRGMAALNPEVVPYAPPLYPLLVGVSYLLFGVSDFAAILVSIAIGTMTIPLVGWIGRYAFGRGAGAAAAWLSAMSGPHIAFSRAALTDTTALFTFLLALAAGMRLLERQNLIRGILLGLAVGLAQNAKYNGFLALPIVFMAWLTGLVHSGNRGQGPLLRSAAFGSLAVIVAAACYWPWYSFVESHGGYAALIQHHRGYFDGVSRWIANAFLQRAQTIALAGHLLGPLTWLPAAWGLAVVNCALLRNLRSNISAPPQWPLMTSVGVSLALVVLVGVGADAPWAIALAITPTLVLDQSAPRRVVGCALLAMFALVPLYHPYARLSLPITGLSWLTGAAMIALVFGAGARRSDVVEGVASASSRRCATALVAAVLLVILGWAAQKPSTARPSDVLGSRDGLKLAARSIENELRALQSTQRRVLRVYARPPLLWYLARVETPQVREPSLVSLTSRAAAGEVGVLDLLQALQHDANLDLEQLIRPTWRILEVLHAPPSLIARLDADPGFVLRDSASRERLAESDSISERVYVLTPHPGAAGAIGSGRDPSP